MIWCFSIAARTLFTFWKGIFLWFEVAESVRTDGESSRAGDARRSLRRVERYGHGVLIMLHTDDILVPAIILSFELVEQGQLSYR